MDSLSCIWVLEGLEGFVVNDGNRHVYTPSTCFKKKEKKRTNP
jgi:hypothetical protein